MPTSRARAREVAFVLLRHSLGSLLDVFELKALLPESKRAEAAATHGGPVHLRRALEELGPTFTKLGQVLSTRPDLVAPEYEIELAKLQDSAPTVPFTDVAAAIESALHRPLAELFERFDAVPIAAASIGQVHAATLPDGSDVVVKVRRPRVLDQVNVDLSLLNRLAAVAARRSAFAARYDPVGLAREFGATLIAELDYVREGATPRCSGAVSEATTGCTFPPSTGTTRAATSSPRNACAA